MYLIKHLGLVVLIFLSLTQLIQATPKDVNVSIPMEFRNMASGDLVNQDVEISSENAVNLHLQGTDISHLNPRTGTDVWRDEISQPLGFQTDLLDTQREVEFIKASMFLPGTIEFTVQQYDSFGKPHIYVVRVSRKIHNIFLRKALLKKIGYIIPPSQHCRQLKVRFRNVSLQERNKLLKDTMWQNLAANPNRWISNFYGIEKVPVENVAGELVEKEQYLFLPSGIERDHPRAKDWVYSEETLFEFQDVMVYPITNHRVFDLSLGYLSSSRNQDLRLLNSVVVAYALTDVPESVNKFSWSLGRIRDNSLVLPYEEYSNYAQQYHPNYEDLLWIMRRIAKLTREDFLEIAQSSPYPDEIVSVVQEKLISRRNYLVKLLDLPFPPLFHKKPSELNSEHLVKGLVQKDFWPGYGSRFAHSQMDSPLSGTEVLSFFKSKLLSNILGNLIHRVNQELHLTQPGNAWQERQIEQRQRQIRKAIEKDPIKFLQTGEYQRTPLGIWTQPTLNGHLTVAREIIIGTYMGAGNDEDRADNMIHLADTFGFGVNMGLIGFVEGLPKNQFAHLKGEVFFSRNYTHLKPLNSIKQSLTEPLRHIFVNFYKRKTAQLLDSLEEFTQHFRVGESLIITDTIGGALEAGAQYGPTNALSLHASLSDSQVVLSRLHIYRSDENTIHIYKDHGNLNSLRLFLGVENHIPIVGLSFNINNGQAKTFFHKLDITNDPETNPFLEDHLLILKNVFLSGSLEMFQSPPVVVKHHFHEKRFNLNLLVYQGTKLNSWDRITVIHPQGEEAEFVRGSLGWRSGTNWQGLGVDVANALIDEVWDEDIVLNIAGSDNPGDTFKGRSRLRQVHLDTLLKDGVPTEHFIQVHHRWKGWELKAKKANKIISTINSRFNYEFFPPHVLINTKRLLLYIIDIDILVYEPAIEHLLEVSKKQAEKFLPGRHNVNSPDNRRRARLHPEVADRHVTPAVVSLFLRNQRACKKRRATMKETTRKTGLRNMKRALRPCIKMVDLVEKNVRSTDDLVALFGSQKNFRIEAQILGYREGDEAAYEPIASHVFGEVGSPKPLGPIMDVLKHPDIRMSSGEFFILWLMNQL